MTDWERTGFLFAHRPSIPSRIHRSFPNRLPSERGPFRRRRLPFQNGSRWQEPAGFFVSMGPTVSDARRGTSLWSHPPHVDPFPRRSSSDGAPILPSFPVPFPRTRPCAVELPHPPGGRSLPRGSSSPPTPTVPPSIPLPSIEISSVPSPGGIDLFSFPSSTVPVRRLQACRTTTQRHRRASHTSHVHTCVKRTRKTRRIEGDEATWHPRPSPTMAAISPRSPRKNTRLERSCASASPVPVDSSPLTWPEGSKEKDITSLQPIGRETNT